MPQGLDTFLRIVRINEMTLSAKQKMRLDGFQRAARIKRRPDAPSAELAMLNWEAGKPLPLACSNPDRLQEYVFGKMIQEE